MTIELKLKKVLIGKSENKNYCLTFFCLLQFLFTSSYSIGQVRTFFSEMPENIGLKIYAKTIADNKVISKKGDSLSVHLSRLPLFDESTMTNYGYNIYIGSTESNEGYINLINDTLFYHTNPKYHHYCRRIDSKLFLNNSGRVSDTIFIYSAGKIIQQKCWVDNIYIDKINKDSLFVLKTKSTKDYSAGHCSASYFSHTNFISSGLKRIIISKKYGIVLIEYVEQFGKKKVVCLVKAIHPLFFNELKEINF